MKYLYSAVFVPGEGGKYYARVPDLPGCITTGNSLPDAIAQITDAAAAWLVVAEDEGLSIPQPAPQDAWERGAGAVFSLIQLDTIAYRARTDTRAVRKNVSLPAWMAELAEKRGLNCSQVLQEALRGKFEEMEVS